MAQKQATIVLLVAFTLLIQLYPAAAQDSENNLQPSPPVILFEEDNSSNIFYDYTIDNTGKIHVISKHNSNYISYSMFNTTGTTLISESPIFQTTNSTMNFEIFTDTNGILHIVWEDYSYSYGNLNEGYHIAIDSSSSPKMGGPVYINDIVVSEKQSLGYVNFTSFDVEIDSKNDIHLIYVDGNNRSTMKYSMYRQLQSGTLQTLISPSVIVEGLGNIDNPSLVIDEDDDVLISWDEARGTVVELVFIVDISGSMYSEWSDLCTLIYGGSFSGGGDYQGLKNVVSDEYGTLILETIYGLGNSLPGAASSGDCAQHNKNSGPRNTPLNETDDSGGVRTLPGTVYNDATYNGYSGEDWGPGSNWACLSWKDSAGMVPGNPPTPSDHKWNYSATKFVLPLSDEGPKDGDPSQQADDITSINEAHDNCVAAGVVPVGLMGQAYGGGSNVESHMRDLAQCPNGVVSTATRNCPGNSVRATDAGGQTYEFPSGTGGASSYWGLIEFFENFFQERSDRNIFLKIIDPMVQVNDPSIVLGSQIGDLEAVTVKNDTLIKSELGNSVDPVVSIDDSNQMHIAWYKSIVNSLGGERQSEILYSKENYIDFKSRNSIVDFNFSIEIISSESGEHSASNLNLIIDDLDMHHITWIQTNETMFTISHHQGTQTSSITNGYVSQTEGITPQMLTAPYYGGGFFLTWVDNQECGGGNSTGNISLCLVHFSDRDSDNDGVTNDLDECPGYDDNIDLDNDTIPDGCDEFVDSDEDGVSDADDRCPGWDDNVDVDNDNTPDGCDAIIDSDGDGVQDTSDICEGFDDLVDIDSDGTPDGCDDNIDSDNDGIPNLDDKCPGYDDSIDMDSDGLPDDCDNLIDSDFDNLSDATDNCPYQYNPGQKDYDSDGLGNDCDDDDDGDLVPDIVDQCPNGMMEWSSSDITDFDSDGCLDSLEDSDDDNDEVIDARDKCPGEIPSEGYIDTNSDGCLDSPEDKTGSSSFFSRLLSGDLDAIGVILALLLPIIGLIYTSSAKSKRRGIMARYEEKIFDAEDDGKLDSIRKEVTVFASKDMISQAQYQILIELINSERERIAIADIKIDEIFDEVAIEYTIGDVITDEHGFEWKNDGNDIYYRHEDAFPEWKKY